MGALGEGPPQAQLSLRRTGIPRTLALFSVYKVSTDLQHSFLQTFPWVDPALEHPRVQRSPWGSKLSWLSNCCLELPQLCVVSCISLKKILRRCKTRKNAEGASAAVASCACRGRTYGA